MFTPQGFIRTSDELCRRLHHGSLVLCLSHRQRRWCLDLWGQWALDNSQEVSAPEPHVYTLFDWFAQQTEHQANGTQVASEGAIHTAWDLACAEALKDKNIQHQGNPHSLQRKARRFSRLCHEWLIPTATPFSQHEMGDLFRIWHTKATTSLHQQGLASHHSLLESHSNAPPKPPIPSVVMVGLVFIPPLIERLLKHWQEDGLHIDSWQPHVAPTQAYHLMPGAQMSHALDYAIDRAYHLSQNKKNVLVVVPDLVNQWSSVFEAFRSRFTPQQDWYTALLDPERPYNLSGGLHLKHLPPVAAALSLLELDANTPMPEVIQLLTHPAITPLIHEDTPETWYADDKLGSLQSSDTNQLWRDFSHLPLHAFAQSNHCYAPWAANVIHCCQKQPHQDWPSTWAHRFDQQLTQCGWMTQVSEDSFDYQVIEQVNALLESLATADSFQQPLRRDQALRVLQSLAGERLFQPRAGDSTLDQAQVQVLAPFEAFGLYFDHTIVCGLDNDRLSALQKIELPITQRLSKSLSMPGSSPEKIAADSALFWNALASTAPAVTLCHPHECGLEDHTPVATNSYCSAQAQLVDGLCTLPTQQWHYNTSTNEHAQPTSTPRVSATTIKAQTACGWQGWWALQGLNLESPTLESYPSPRWKGQVLHAIFAALFTDHRDQIQSFFDDQSSQKYALTQCINTLAHSAIYSHRSLAPMLISQTLTAHYADFFTEAVYLWLKNKEQPLAIHDCEVSYKNIDLGSLTIRSLRIDRIDRIGTTDSDTEFVVIDYKTGSIPKLPHQQTRIEDPQLLIYARALQEHQHKVAGLGYAKVLPMDQSKWSCCGSPKASTYINKKGLDDWDDVLKQALSTLEQRIQLYSDGVVALDPISLESSCRYCALQASCRIGAQSRIPPTTAPEALVTSQPTPSLPTGPSVDSQPSTSP